MFFFTHVSIYKYAYIYRGSYLYVFTWASISLYDQPRKHSAPDMKIKTNLLIMAWRGVESVHLLSYSTDWGVQSPSSTSELHLHGHFYLDPSISLLWSFFALSTYVKAIRVCRGAGEKKKRFTRSLHQFEEQSGTRQVELIHLARLLLPPLSRSKTFSVTTAGSAPSPHSRSRMKK